MQPSPFNAAPAPAAPRPKWTPGKIIAIGCGVPFLGLIGLIILGVIFGGNTPSKSKSTDKASTTTSTASLTPYTGKWQGQDGTSIWIRDDGKADFDAGSTKVSGGGVTLDEKAKTLRISSFFGIGKTWTITASPHKSNGNTEMTLNGTVYRRSDGFDSGNSSTSGGESQANALPSDKEQQRLVRESLEEFDNALRDKDFSNFYKASSRKWQEQTTPQEIKTAFQSFLDKKIRLADTLEKSTPTFSPAAHIADGMLELQGYYPVRPYRVYFKLGYLNEDGTWKLGSLHVKIGDPIKD